MQLSKSGRVPGVRLGSDSSSRVVVGLTVGVGWAEQTAGVPGDGGADRAAGDAVGAVQGARGGADGDRAQDGDLVRELRGVQGVVGGQAHGEDERGVHLSRCV